MRVSGGGDGAYAMSSVHILIVLQTLPQSQKKKGANIAPVKGVSNLSNTKLDHASQLWFGEETRSSVYHQPATLCHLYNKGIKEKKSIIASHSRGEREERR